MPSDGFRSVSLKAEVVNQVEKLVNSSSSQYRSIAEFVSEAIRLRFEQIRRDESEHVEDSG